MFSNSWKRISGTLLLAGYLPVWMTVIALHHQAHQLGLEHRCASGVASGELASSESESGHSHTHSCVGHRGHNYHNNGHHSHHHSHGVSDLPPPESSQGDSHDRPSDHPPHDSDSCVVCQLLATKSISSPRTALVSDPVILVRTSGPHTSLVQLLFTRPHDSRGPPLV